MKRLGIDFGEKRWGVSFADEVGVATPLPALVQADPEQRWIGLAELIRNRRVEAIVVGYPYRMDGSVGGSAQRVDGFVVELERRFPGLPVSRVDERLSSQRAGSHWSLKKLIQERKSGKLDSLAASLILQDYLEQHELLPDPGWDEHGLDDWENGDED